MNTYVGKLLSTKMTRKEFLVYVGVGFLGVFGVSSLLKFLAEYNFQPKNQKQNNPFGTGGYGV